MTTEEYLAALKALELRPCSKFAAGVLGLSVRQLQRLASGEDPIPAPIAILLETYIEHGLRPNR